MAQTGYTPILIYSSTTSSNAPAAGNLTNSALGSELAINIADGKLFYKDSGGSVQVIAWKTTPTTAGGTGLTSYAAGDLLYYVTGTTLSKLAIGASKTILTSSGTAPQWSTSLDTTQGGTGLTSYTAGDLLYFSTGSTLSKLAIGANTYVLTSNGSSPAWVAPSSIAIGTATNLAGGAAGSVPYQTAASTTTMLAIGSAYQGLQVNAGGTAPSWQASSTSTLTAQGDLLYASAANTLARLAKNTTATRYLSNTGSNNNPAWAQVDLTNGVTGTLPTGNGGTGLTSFTANGVLYASSTSALATGSAFTFDGTTVINKVSRSSGANVTAFTLSDNVTGAQTAGFGTQIRGLSNNGSAVSAIGFETGGTGTNNETQIAFYTQNAGSSLTRRATIDSLGNWKLAAGSLYFGASGTGIYDANSNAALLFTATASSVNYLTIANAAANGSPTISATGTDTNIPIKLTPKGTGYVNITTGVCYFGDTSSAPAHDAFATVSVTNGSTTALVSSKALATRTAYEMWIIGTENNQMKFSAVVKAFRRDSTAVTGFVIKEYEVSSGTSITAAFVNNNDGTFTVNITNNIGYTVGFQITLSQVVYGSI